MWDTGRLLADETRVYTNCSLSAEKIRRIADRAMSAEKKKREGERSRLHEYSSYRVPIDSSKLNGGTGKKK